MTEKNTPPEESPPGSRKFQLTEDWLAVLIAFGIILLGAVGILGEDGISIGI